MIDLDVVAQLCRRATVASGGVVLTVVRDPLDDSLWVRMSSWPRAQEALTALHGYGLSAVDRSDCRLQVTGWDARLLRRRLGTLLAGVNDLQVEWDATAELARYHRDRRVAAGEDPEDFDVLADVEHTLREAKPIPHAAPGSDDVDTLLQLIDAADDAYAQLLTRHVDYAGDILASYRRDRGYSKGA